MVADPVASYADFLEGLSADADWATQARQLVTTATTPENHGYTPSLANPPQTPERRPGGVALTTGMDRHNRFEGRDRAAEVVFYESGRLALVSERPTFIWSFSNVNPPPPRPESGAGGTDSRQRGPHSPSGCRRLPPVRLQGA